MHITVIDISRGAKCDIRVDRKTIYGNFAAGPREPRSQQVALFEAYIQRHPELIRELANECLRQAHTLRKTVIHLGCHCAPLACHADILKREVEKLLAIHM